MAGTVSGRRRRSSSVGTEEKVKKSEELGWRSAWEEARAIGKERRRVMEEQGQTKWVFRVGGGSFPDALVQQREGWRAAVKHNTKMWKMQDKEEKRLEGALEKVKVEKTEAEKRIREAEEELAMVDELLGKVGQGQGDEWVVAADRPCSCLGACGCLVEVKLVLGKEERKEVVLQPEGVATEVLKEEKKQVEKSQVEKSQVEKSQVEKSQEGKMQEEEEERLREELATREHEMLVSQEVEREVQKVEEARIAVTKAQLDMMEKDELIGRCVRAGHWERVDELVSGLRKAWTVMRANEGEVGWPDKWWSMVSYATIARGEAAVALKQWERLLAVVGKFGEGSAKIPQQGQIGWSTERRAKWFLLRAKSRRHQRQFGAARSDLGTVTYLANKWASRQWAKVG